MGQRQFRRVGVEEGGGECVRGINPPTLTPTDHKAELHPRPDETPVGVGIDEGGGQERKQKGTEEPKKNRQKKRAFRRFSSVFFFSSRPKSTKAQDEQVEQCEVDQDTDEAPSRRCTDDQTSLQDIICSVEDNDHQAPSSSSPEVPSTAKNQQVVDVKPQDPSPASSSSGDTGSHLLRQLDCDKIVRAEDHICWKYAIGKKLGEGSFGSVFEGTRCKDGLMVAVKFTAKTGKEPYISLPDHPRPVPLEVALTVMANQGPCCRHIIKLLDWQDHLDQYIMVLERPSPCMDMHGFWLRSRGRFSEKLARHFMRQVIVAAALCCSRGVLHRDIKMQNLLVNTKTLVVKLIDFGCGDIMKCSSYENYAGTAVYCPPEFFKKGEYFGKQATVWSLGVLLFAMISCRFPDSRDFVLMDRDVWFQSGFSNECCRFIQGCLKSDPKQRLHLDEMLFHDWFKVIEERRRDGSLQPQRLAGLAGLGCAWRLGLRWF
ncbi:serine/threonine-protein kinase pim-2-like [Pimephales promelas]|uniref:serine/threonine-protein kinase pim-2-like n=1 Tax=Pimephales promelas TaxID=90988 RepID=UPI001955C79F|nr:serine/threonine-protein kinase pim-2-like [Pimephales promelas]KAG1931968.1 aurora kinase [Pimephales promelas]KAG1931972.1 aurora kinase [Pimephales promelas]